MRGQWNIFCQRHISRTSYHHRWALPVLHYPTNMVIYHYPPIEVIFMVILHVFIIKYYPYLFSSYYHKFIVWVIYPFILNFGEFICEVIFPEYYPIIREETAMFSYFGIIVSLSETWYQNKRTFMFPLLQSGNVQGKWLRI